jgi:hypothetical protein
MLLPFASLLFAAAMAAPPAAAPSLSESALLDAPTRHIRTVNNSVHKLLRSGFKRSPSFAALVRRLQASDVYVYIEELPKLPGSLDGRMMMLPRAHEHRYVRIQIVLRGSPEDSVAVLGHELQHAVEVAEAEDVIDDEGMVRLYQKIGMRGGAHLYDTAAAQEMGRTVRREMAS